MNQYLRNVTLWLRGFGWLWDDSRIRYKPKPKSDAAKARKRKSRKARR